MFKFLKAFEMKLISNSSETDSDFKKIMAELNDEQLKEVLRKRSLYQKEAAALAVSEAVKRGLISSESDLSSPEFSETKLKRQLFPEINDEKTRFRVIKSISRVILLAGLIPAVLGAMRLSQGNNEQGVLMIGFALIWMATAYSMFRKFSKIMLFILAILTFLSLLFTAMILIFQLGITFMDKFIVTVLYLLTTYGLIYIKKLGK